MKKKLLSLLFTSLLFVGVSTVKASTDINDWTVTVEAETGNAGAGLKMTVDGEGEKGNNYYVVFVNEGDEKPVFNSWKDVPKYEYDSEEFKQYVPIYFGDANQDKEFYTDREWYLLKGYDYLYFLKCDYVGDKGCETSENPIKLVKPELPELDQRYHFFYFEDGNRFDVFPYYPYPKKEKLKYQFKFGLVNNKELLYSLYKEESGALKKLLEYAKEADDKVYEFSSNGLFDDNVIDKFDIVDGGYYYMYATLKDENGIYRDVSGITLAMGSQTHLVNDIEWSYGDENSNATVEEEKVEKNPSTADTNIALILGALAVCGSLIVIGKKKISAK